MFFVCLFVFCLLEWPLWKVCNFWFRNMECRKKVCFPGLESLSSKKSLFSQEVDVSCTTIKESVLMFIHLFICSFKIYHFPYYVSDIGNKKVNKSWSLPELLIHGRDRQNNYKSV